MQELPSPWREIVVDASTVTTGESHVAAPPSEEAAVLKALTVDDAQHIEEVIVRSGLAPARVTATLLSLELAGRARQLEGQRWIRDRRA